MSTFRFAVSVMPRDGHPRPAGPCRRDQPAAPGRRPTVHGVRVGRRVELAVEAPDDAARRGASWSAWPAELFANPLIESWTVEPCRRRRA